MEDIDVAGSGKTEFLSGEMRCGFNVTPERKRVWKTLLDIFEVFTAVCDKHGLEWYACAGTLLGAVRHKGFIPWDDDLDVAMPRKDYEKLQEVLPAELPPHLFMQTTLTDPEYDICHLKIRDSRTSAIEMAHVRQGRRYNMGMFLDVFPLDAVPDDDAILRKAERRHKRLRAFHIVALRRKFNSFKQRITTWLCRPVLKLIGNKRFYRMREDVLRKIPGAADSKRCMYGGGNTWRENLVFMREWYSSAEELPFEYLKVRVPKGYEACLAKEYGSDWRTPRNLPACHSIDMDVDTPYIETLAGMEGVR